MARTRPDAFVRYLPVDADKQDEKKGYTEYRVLHIDDDGDLVAAVVGREETDAELECQTLKSMGYEPFIQRRHVTQWADHRVGKFKRPPGVQ